MISFTVLDHGLYIDGNHVADFESMELAKANARTLIKSGAGESAVIVCNYTGEVEYSFDKATEVVTVETYVEGGQSNLPLFAWVGRGCLPCAFLCAEGVWGERACRLFFVQLVQIRRKNL